MGQNVVLVSQQSQPIAAIKGGIVESIVSPLHKHVVKQVDTRNQISLALCPALGRIKLSFNRDVSRHRGALCSTTVVQSLVGSDCCRQRAKIGSIAAACRNGATALFRCLRVHSFFQSDWHYQSKLPRYSYGFHRKLSKTFGGSIGTCRVDTFSLPWRFQSGNGRSCPTIWIHELVAALLNDFCKNRNVGVKGYCIFHHIC